MSESNLPPLHHYQSQAEANKPVNEVDYPLTTAYTPKPSQIESGASAVVVTTSPTNLPQPALASPLTMPHPADPTEAEVLSHTYKRERDLARAQLAQLSVTFEEKARAFHAQEVEWQQSERLRVRAEKQVRSRSQLLDALTGDLPTGMVIYIHIHTFYLYQIYMYGYMRTYVCIYVYM